jgi:hypothetical protein
VFGNVAEQAAYRGWRADSDGQPINGAEHAYTLTMKPDDLGQVGFFWSVTMYLLPDPSSTTAQQADTASAVTTTEYRRSARATRLPDPTRTQIALNEDLMRTCGCCS